MKHWRTTAIGLSLAMWEILNTIPDITSLSWKELGLRGLKALCVASLGILAKDFDSEAPKPGS